MMPRNNIIQLADARSPRREATPRPVAEGFAAIEQLRQRLRDDRPDLFEAFEPTLADDWREFISEVRAEPFSHALVALFAIIGWTLLLITPLALGWLS